MQVGLWSGQKGVVFNSVLLDGKEILPDPNPHRKTMSVLGLVQENLKIKGEELYQKFGGKCVG